MTTCNWSDVRNSWCILHQLYSSNDNATLISRFCWIMILRSAYPSNSAFKHPGTDQLIILVNFYHILLVTWLGKEFTYDPFIVEPELTLHTWNHVETTSKKWTLNWELFWPYASGSHFYCMVLRKMNACSWGYIRSLFLIYRILLITIPLVCYWPRISLSDNPFSLFYPISDDWSYRRWLCLQWWLWL